ncbi:MULTISPECIES: LURP-one-related/scramblase family protein [unclassified Methanosarcina]|uniref:LURP-one-related/scramblase family protein n=1 Tax=unclassified Methanosarcina TaxID=2644672 RepID=UPI0025E9E299|nr:MULTISPECIES: LURP-one-related family protein [unclassified Methanosarcina]
MIRRIMGGLRSHGEEGVQRYKMHEKLVTIGDDYWIENEAGEKAFYVDGKALRIRNTLIIKDMQGNELYKLKEKLLRIKDTMDIQDAGGETVATIKKALITPLRDRWKVEVSGGPEMDVQGNILNHEYDIEVEKKKVAEVSKKWFRIRDTYGVEVSPGQDAALVLAIAAALDQMAHD